MTKINSSQFFNYIGNLSPEAEFYFYSQAVGRALREIKDKYQAKEEDYFFDLFNYYTVQDFDFSDLRNELAGQFPQLSDGEITAIGCDAIGMLFLPVATLLPDKAIEKQLSSWGGKAKDYHEYIEAFNNELEEKQLDLLESAVEAFDKKVDKEEEMRDMEDLLINDLLAILNDKNKDSLNMLNGELIYFLSKFPQFKNRLANNLLENKEKLGNGSISLSGQKAEPSIGNWLLDFVNQKGSDYFDNVVLSDYLANSANARQLDNDNKKILAKVLVLYRNLKFFPQTLENLPPEKWGIIPIETAKEQPLGSNRQGAAPVRQENDWDLAQLTELERKAIEEEKK